MRFQWRATCWIVAVLLLGWAEPARAGEIWVIAGGKSTLSLHSLTLERHGLVAMPTGPTGWKPVPHGAEITTLTFIIDASTDVRLVVRNGIIDRLEGSIRHAGGLAVIGPKEERVLEPFVLRLDQTDRPPERFAVIDLLGGNVPALILRDTNVVIDSAFGGSSTLMITSDAVALSPEWATALGRPNLAGRTIGSAVVNARLVQLDVDQLTGVSEIIQSFPGTAAGAGTVGPDVIVGNLPAMNNYGSENGISAFSVATDSCNIGDEPLLWIAGTNEHPVIAQHMYRLKNNRFEQIGMSWLKHGFFALTSSLCDTCDPPSGVPSGTRLGVGCSDLYSAHLNGMQSNLGPRSQVDAHTGIFTFPFAGCSGCGAIDRRVQVHDVDLNNPGAQYFVEGHYVTPDDAMAGNGNNNASYRPIVFVPPGSCFPALDPNEFCAVPAPGPGNQTRRQQPAIRAWRDNDTSVVETDVQIPGEGLFLLAAKAINLGNIMWRYEYAVQNLNSDRSGVSFSVPVPAGAIVENIDFHDVDYHSGEPYDLTDWPATVAGGSVTWSTTSFDVNPNANALRWGTLYNFRFDADVEPDTTMVTIGLFKTGFPEQVTASTTGPALGLVDCNGNGIRDACDVDCGAFECEPPPLCGESVDCNGNGVPDECELETNDCNGNGVVDACDISVADGGFCVGEGCSSDCQPDTVPDECELEGNDCNANGIPDECDPSVDCDQDGIDDCLDLCPCNSPADACICPLDGCCVFPSFPCLDGFTQANCESSGGTWVCNHPPCRDGCLIGDFDQDGDVDMEDWGHFTSCFSGPIGEPGFVPPSVECLLGFDFDDDGDVDSMDLAEFTANLTGPTGVRTVCEGLCAECATDLDCDDGNACTVDACSDIVCSHTPIPDCVPCVGNNPCDDGEFCTGNDVCVEGVCVGTPIPGCQPCTVAGGFCSDGSACTDDVCIGLDCVTTPNFDESVDCCDPATGGLTPLDDGNMCTDDVCDPATGQVSHFPVPDGTACDDGQFCTDSETCTNGVCGGGSPPDCSALDDQCNVGVCNEVADLCEGEPRAAGTPCNDGLFCTDGETCTAGICGGGSPRDCSALDDPCNAGVCSEEQDICEPLPANEAALCDDGLFCTDGETCTNGVCGGGVLHDCSALDDQCNMGDCNEEADLCEGEPRVAGTPCDDQDECTIDDVCDGAGGCSGTLICNDVPELCLVAVPGELPVEGCFGPDEQIVVNVVLNPNAPSTAVIAGGSFLIGYDPTALQVVGVAPGSAVDPNSPFSVRIVEVIDEVEGKILYAVGIDLNEPGTQGPAVMATIRFVSLVSCATIVPLCFLNEAGTTTALIDINGDKVPFIPCCSDSLMIHGEGPVLNCPGSVTTNTDAGSVTALVTWEPASINTGCDVTPELNCSATHDLGANIDGLINAGGQFPTGVSTFECTATDHCAVSDTCLWSVRINPSNAVEASVQLSPTISAGPLRRCIVFEFFSSCVEAPVVVEQTLDFGLPFHLPGRADQVALDIPAGQYACATARDPLHTLRSASGLTIVGPTFIADFRGDPFFGGNWLVGGNLNDDRVIDILDFGTFVAEFLSSANPNTPCGTSGPHADINGDGVVDALDFAFITTNFLHQDGNACCPGGTASVMRQPITQISVRELRSMGLSHLERADLNGDGLLNEADIAVFLEGQASPKPGLLRPPRER